MGIWRGTSTLLAANLVNRLVDFVYRVYLVRIVGAEFIGLFHMAVPPYSIMLLLSGAGVAPAVGNLVAERLAAGDPAGVSRVFRRALMLVLAAGTIMSTLFLTGAGIVSERMLGDSRLHLMLLSIAPAILIVSVSGIYRGYFQGRQQMLPVALAQLVEQVVTLTVTIGLLLGIDTGNPGLKLGLMGVGVTAGELAGLGVLQVLWGRCQREIRPHPWARRTAAELNCREIDHKIVGLAAPVTLTRMVATMSLALGAVLIPRELMAAGSTRSEAVALYGLLTGLAMPIVAFPSLITFAVSYNLIPAVAAAQAREDYGRVKYLLAKTLSLTQWATVPLVVTALLFPGEISHLIYGTTAPAPALRIMALAAPLLYIEQVETGVLQGLSRPALNLRNYAVSEALTVTLFFVLVKPLGLAGAAWAVGLGIMAEAILDYASVSACLKEKISTARIFLPPLAAGLIMAAVAMALVGPSRAIAGPGPAAMAGPLAAGLAVFAFIFILWHRR